MYALFAVASFFLAQVRLYYTNHVSHLAVDLLELQNISPPYLIKNRLAICLFLRQVAFFVHYEQHSTVYKNALAGMLRF